jgi:hypothetical protein
LPGGAVCRSGFCTVCGFLGSPCCDGPPYCISAPVTQCIGGQCVGNP